MHFRSYRFSIPRQLGRCMGEIDDERSSIYLCLLEPVGIVDAQYFTGR